MAAQTSLLPVYHKTQESKNSATDMNMDMDLSTWMTQDNSLQDEAFLQELLSGQGDDLLSSLLESTPGTVNPSSSSIGAPLTFDFDTNFHGFQANSLHPTSPVGSDGCASDTNYSSLTNGGSPLINGNGGVAVAPSVIAESLSGGSPHHMTESPNHSPGPLISSTQLPATGMTDPSQLAMDPSLDFNDFSGVDLTNLNVITSDATITSTSLSPPPGPTHNIQTTCTSSDVRINVEPHSSGMRGSVSSDASIAGSPLSSLHSPSPPCSSGSPPPSSNRKAATLLLTDEEKRLLSAEGITLPTDMPLTKAEQKQLKRVQRKIKNKISAQESRKRKKDYVEGLEDRVKICTERNQELKREVDCLKSENQSLLAQLKKLQAIVLQYNPTKAQAGTVVMVLILSFSLFLVPRFAPGTGGGPRGALQAIKGFSHHSRTLLFAETDEFGNVIDPETGRIISPFGGQSPSPPFPWVYQTPAILNFHKVKKTTLAKETSNSSEERSAETSPSSNDS